jgi:hypothetical protein
MAGHPIRPCTSDDEALLGALAMTFRGTRDSTKRKAIAKQYAKTVKKLVDGGCWKEMPAPEDQLPDNFMPKGFFEYWSRERGD